jgi:hypothetical protein
MWTVRAPGDNDKWSLTDGRFVFDILAGQDLWLAGVDGAPFLLTDPPKDDTNYSIETMVDPLVDVAAQPPSSQCGIILFREDVWAYTLFGPYAATDIRVEDCGNGTYRWRADNASVST